MKLAVWDLDNTLANDHWRFDRINWSSTDMDERYDAYHAACAQDAPAHVAFFRALSAHATPAFLTARPETVRYATERWITRHLLYAPTDYAPVLLMREVGNHEPSPVLKRRMVERLLNVSSHQIVAAFDDREDVCQMYRERFGISAMRLWVHDACALTAPTPPTTKANDEPETPQHHPV